jgi:hypothetical protein
MSFLLLCCLLWLPWWTIQSLWGNLVQSAERPVAGFTFT